MGSLFLSCLGLRAVQSRSLTSGTHLEIWELLDPWPRPFCRGAKVSEDAHNLVQLGVALVDGVAGRQLCKDAADCPHVNGARVQLGSKQNLRCAVPERHNLQCQTRGV